MQCAKAWPWARSFSRCASGGDAFGTWLAVHMPWLRKIHGGLYGKLVIHDSLPAIIGADLVAAALHGHVSGPQTVPSQHVRLGACGL